MTDLKSRLKPVFRRSSTSSPKSDLSPSPTSSAVGADRSWSKNSSRLGKNKKPSLGIPVYEEKELPPPPPILPEDITQVAKIPKVEPLQTPRTGLESPQEKPERRENPRVVVKQPTPEQRGRSLPKGETETSPSRNPERLSKTDAQFNGVSRPNLAERRHSPISFDQPRLFPPPQFEEQPTRVVQSRGHFRNRSQAYATMQHRKVWVKRANAVPTQVSIGEDDLVDDVKDMILRKYANSLGRNFDPPDVTLKVALGPRSSRHTNERTLGPDENISKILDMHYPGGQSIEEALIIDVPHRRTPKHSPRVAMPYYLPEDLRPGEHAADYFPPMPINGPHSPHPPSNLSVSSGHVGLHRTPLNTHSISVLETGQIPNLPSPGAGRARHSDRSARPRTLRQHTTSPIILAASTHSQTHGTHHSNLIRADLANNIF